MQTKVRSSNTNCWLICRSSCKEITRDYSGNPELMENQLRENKEYQGCVGQGIITTNLALSKNIFCNIFCNQKKKKQGKNVKIFFLSGNSKHVNYCPCRVGKFRAKSVALFINTRGEKIN